MIQTRFLAGALALSAALAVAACSGPEPSAENAEAPKSSSAGLPPGRIDVGAKRALVKSVATGQTCIDCHGKNGNMPLDPTYPKLGGQYRDYLAQALQMYRNGGRQHALMSAQAKDLSDQEIADLSAYFASRPGQLRDLYGLD